jgi:hypothetical protein
VTRPSPPNAGDRVQTTARRQRWRSPTHPDESPHDQAPDNTGQADEGRSSPAFNGRGDSSAGRHPASRIAPAGRQPNRRWLGVITGAGNHRARMRGGR